MYLLNYRHGGDGTIRFAKHPQWTLLQRPGAQIRPDFRGLAVCLLVHGYNVDEAEPKYAQIALSLGPSFTYVGLKWPGSRLVGSFLEPAWLPFSVFRRADKAGYWLAAEPELRAGSSLDVVAHSLGCRVALRAAAEGLPIRNLVLCAPAVDNEVLRPGEPYHGALKNCDRVVVAWSRNDPALTAYVAARMDIPLGLSFSGQMAALCGPNVQSWDCSETVKGHGGHFTSPEFLHRMDELVGTKPVAEGRISG